MFIYGHDRATVRSVDDHFLMEKLKQTFLPELKEDWSERSWSLPFHKS